jgi:hypothetical protein
MGAVVSAPRRGGADGRRWNGDCRAAVAQQMVLGHLLLIQISLKPRKDQADLLGPAEIGHGIGD